MAIVFNDGARLYLNSWEYNMARVISELGRIVQERGGRCKPMKYALVSNRQIYNKIHELEKDIECYTRNLDLFKDAEKIEKLKSVIEKKRGELEQLKTEAENETPVKVEYTSYIDFVLNDTRYYFEIDDNPFFPVHALKTPVKNGKYSRDAYCFEIETPWAVDELLLRSATETTVKETARAILEQLASAKNSGIYRDGKKQRVPNIYDGGYHYETVYRPERIATIDY